MMLSDLHLERLEISQKIIEEKSTSPRLRNQRGLEGGARAVEEAPFLELEKASTSATKIEYEERQIEKLEEELL